jgi:hypothetical protein
MGSGKRPVRHPRLIGYCRFPPGLEPRQRLPRTKAPSLNPTEKLISVGQEDISWLEVEGEVIVLSIPTSRYLSVNESGSMMWRDLLSGTTATKMAAQLMSAYQIDQSTADHDVAEFLESLRQHGLLREPSP